MNNLSDMEIIVAACLVGVTMTCLGLLLEIVRKRGDEVMSKVHVTRHEGYFYVLSEVKCSMLQCGEFGCDFPNCALESDGERFDTLEAAKEKHPNLELV